MPMHVSKFAVRCRLMFHLLVCLGASFTWMSKFMPIASPSIPLKTWTCQCLGPQIRTGCPSVCQQGTSNDPLATSNSLEYPELQILGGDRRARHLRGHDQRAHAAQAFGPKPILTGVCEQKHPPEKQTRGKTSFQCAKSEAGMQFLLMAPQKERGGLKIFHRARLRPLPRLSTEV